MIAGGAALNVAHVMALLAASTYIYGIREGYRRPAKWAPLVARWVSLESMLAAGLVMFMLGLGILLGIVGYWSSIRYAAIGNVLPAVIGTTLVAIGAQNALGGFLLAIIAGNEAKFMDASARNIAKARSREQESLEGEENDRQIL